MDKQRERAILDYYLGLVGLGGEVEEHERPDFIVQSGGKRIGVEITEYHQPQHSADQFPRKMVEAEWAKIRASVVEYREAARDIDKLSVLLTFLRLEVPAERQHAEFIRAVHDQVRAVLPVLKSRFTTVAIGEAHQPILRQYLKSIDVRNARSYIEWAWNHDTAWVGTTDEELQALLRKKLALKRPDDVAELHLVLAGDGPSGATYIGYLTPELLSGWAGITCALDASECDALTILNYDESCIWRRGAGWSAVQH